MAERIFKQNTRTEYSLNDNLKRVAIQASIKLFHFREALCCPCFRSPSNHSARMTSSNKTRAWPLIYVPQAANLSKISFNAFCKHGIYRENMWFKNIT